MKSMRVMKTVAVTTALLCVGIAFLFGASYHAAHVNIRVDNDQTAYLQAIKKIHSAHYYWYLGDRNRMPLYPYVQALFYKKNMNNQELFIQAKIVNCILSLFLVFSLFFIMRKYLGSASALLTTAVIGLTVLMMRAPYVQVENAYYFFSFLTLLLSVEALKLGSIKDAIAAGAMCAVTYLCKASILLLLYLFLGTLFLRILLHGYHAIQQNNERNFFRIKNIMGLLGVFLKFGGMYAAIFLLCLSPYLLENVKIFGTPFYNVNTKFYMWNDSWEDVCRSTRAHGDRVGWPTMPKKELPGLVKYVREHSFREIAMREFKGLRKVVHTMTASGTYPRIAFKYILIFGIFAAVSMLRNRKRADAFFRKNASGAIMVMAFLILSIFLFAWYTPIASGPRFVLGLYLPLLFASILLGERMSQDWRIKWKGKEFWKIIHVLYVGAAVMLIFDTMVLIFSVLRTQFLID